MIESPTPRTTLAGPSQYQSHRVARGRIHMCTHVHTRTYTDNQMTPGTIIFDTTSTPFAQPCDTMNSGAAQYEQLELSLRQLITLLNLVAEEHITCDRALALLEAVGVTVPGPTSVTVSSAHVQRSTPQPTKQSGHLSKPEDRRNDDISALASRFERSVTIPPQAGPSSSRKGKTSTRHSPALLHPPASSNVATPLTPPSVKNEDLGRSKPPAEKRWYCVTAGEVVGAVHSW